MAFAVCGESFLPLLDALLDRPQLRLISCRHEAGAADDGGGERQVERPSPACAWCRAGPGACHATIGLHTAFQDATPLVMLVGQVPRSVSRAGSAAGNRVSPHARPAREMGRANRSGRAHSGARASRVSRRCVRPCWAGRAGAAGRHAGGSTGAADCPPAPLARAYPGRATSLPRCGICSRRAERPIADRRRRAVERRCVRCDRAIRRRQRPPRVLQLSAPRPRLVAATIASWASSPCRRTPRSLRRLREADVVLAVGTRLSEPTTQDYTLLDVPVPRARSSCTSIRRPKRSAASIGRRLRSSRDSSNSRPRLPAMKIAPSEPTLGMARGVRQIYLDDSRVPASGAGDWMPVRRWRWLRTEHLPDDAIVTFDAGAFTGWPQRFLAFGTARSRRLLRSAAR